MFVLFHVHQYGDEQSSSCWAPKLRRMENPTTTAKHRILYPRSANKQTTTASRDNCKLNKPAQCKRRSGNKQSSNNNNACTQYQKCLIDSSSRSYQSFRWQQCPFCAGSNYGDLTRYKFWIIDVLLKSCGWLINILLLFVRSLLYCACISLF